MRRVSNARQANQATDGGEGRLALDSTVLPSVGQSRRQKYCTELARCSSLVFTSKKTSTSPPSPSKISTCGCSTKASPPNALPGCTRIRRVWASAAKRHQLARSAAPKSHERCRLKVVIALPHRLCLPWQSRLRFLEKGPTVVMLSGIALLGMLTKPSRCGAYSDCSLVSKRVSCRIFKKCLLACDGTKIYSWVS